MSDHAKEFVLHLQRLMDRDRGAMATLRHSLAFAPGAYPKAYPYVEPFAGRARHAQDPLRLALYIAAGLFAIHPEQRDQSFASSLGELLRKRESPSLEKRFVALLEADPENIAEYLRQSVSLLAAEGIGFDYVRLIDELARWLSPSIEPEWRDQIRQRWARDFYRAAESTTDVATQEKDD